MSNSHFVIRQSCPGCKSTDTKTIYKKPFAEPPISDYLTSFYASRGTVEFEYLEGSDYILEECSNCGMIYQKEIANDELMKRLYEIWLNPVKTFDQHQKNDDLEHYFYYAQEIMQTIVRVYDQIRTSGYCVYVANHLS